MADWSKSTVVDAGNSFSAQRMYTIGIPSMAGISIEQSPYFNGVPPSILPASSKSSGFCPNVFAMGWVARVLKAFS